jgi:hypothetical protein
VLLARVPEGALARAQGHVRGGCGARRRLMSVSFEMVEFSNETHLLRRALAAALGASEAEAEARK